MSVPRKELVVFEDFVKLVKIIKFRKVRNKLQTQLAADLKQIKSSSKIVILGDKI